MNQDINNNDQLQEIKNCLFSNKNNGKNKELDCYTALDFENGDDLTKRMGKSKLATEEKLKKINKQSPFNEDYINKNIKGESLSSIVNLKTQIQSYIANLQKEENSKGNNDIAKMTEDKNSNLYRFKCTLDYIEQIEKSLGFSLEKLLEETSDKFLLLEQKEKLEKQYEGKTKTSNSEKKPLDLSVESYVLLSKIREDSVKILSNSSLRSAYDEGVKKGELKPLASYEECLKYQQKEVTAEVADNSTSSWHLFGSIGNMVNNAKNWCYNITEQMVNFTNTKLKSSAFYPNLNVDNSSEAEHGTPGKYRMTITEVTIQPHCSQNSKTFHKYTS